MSRYTVCCCPYTEEEDRVQQMERWDTAIGSDRSGWVGGAPWAGGVGGASSAVVDMNAGTAPPRRDGTIQGWNSTSADSTR